MLGELHYQGQSLNTRESIISAIVDAYDGASTIPATPGVHIIEVVDEE